MTADPQIQEFSSPNSHFGRKCQVSTEGEYYDASVRKTFKLEEIKMFINRLFALFVALAMGLAACTTPATSTVHPSSISLPMSTDTVIQDSPTLSPSVTEAVKPFP